MLENLRYNMKRARKSNRVSWAPGSNLCQVKLFLSEDFPSKVGQKFQNHLQAKTSSMLPSSTNEDDDLPPGFGGNHFMNRSKAELSHISQIKWQRPPAIASSHHWRVAAGEDSTEKEYIRETRVLEAVYPRLSAIPPSPFVSFEVEEEDYDDNLTANIPVIPIEEEESMDLKPEVAPTKPADNPSKLQSQSLPQYMPAATSPKNSQCRPSSSTVPSSAYGKPLSGTSSHLEADLAAASAVIEAIMKSSEQGSLIDMDLLLRIFNDPIMIERLLNEYRTAASTVSASSDAVGIPTSKLKPANTPKSAMGLLPASRPKQATQSVSLLTPKTEKPAISSVSVLNSSTFDKPANPSVPLFMPVSGKSAATRSVTLPTPPSAPTPLMHRPANKNIPQQDTVLSSGVKRAASMASISSSELSTVALPSASLNLQGVKNQVPSTASTVPYQSGTGSAFGVKNANYYKNLIRQHGADKQDFQDPTIGIRNNNFQDLKAVHKIIKPGEMVFKTQKPCIYFRSSSGCRNGSNCPYKHDMSVQFGAGDVLVTQSAKRMRLGPEIKGCI